MTIKAEEKKELEQIIKTEWSKIAKEQLSGAEIIKGTTYVYGSELATLRLFKYFTEYGSDLFKNRHSYSENLKTYYFSRTKF